MTAGERDKIDLLFRFVKEWRAEDATWKRDADGRLRSLEEYVASEQALDDATERRGLGNRARLAILVSSLGVTLTTILSVIALLTR